MILAQEFIDMGFEAIPYEGCSIGTLIKHGDCKIEWFFTDKSSMEKIEITMREHIEKCHS